MHKFEGNWITDEVFAALRPRQIFGRDTAWLREASPELRNSHILFRRRFTAPAVKRAVLYFTADDYAKIYLNGRLVALGPAPAYHFRLGYLSVDVTDALKEGENVLAAHTYYQGLINRAWQSGDCRHGLILDLEADGRCLVKSDGSFLTARHGGYAAIGTYGYDTTFAESYDSRAAEAGFCRPEFDDRAWKNASVRKFTDYTLVPQISRPLTLEDIPPVTRTEDGRRVRVDFGGVRVGYLNAEARGKDGSVVTVRCAQELTEDGSLRWQLRASKCDYCEPWTLSGKIDRLDWFDYKALRYAEFELPEGAVLGDVTLTVRHYPFAPAAKLRPEFEDDEAVRSVFFLCANTLRYGAQEVIQDCMERERGCYIADSTYTSLTHDLLTGDGTLSRKLLDDAFASAAVTETLGCTTASSFVHNCAEYPLILVRLALWYYRLHGDKRQLCEDYEKVCAVLDGYRRDYERGGLLEHMDKWCVIEWPKNYRADYAVDPPQHTVFEKTHLVLDAHYYEALRHANAMARALGRPPYRDTEPIRKAIVDAFYDEKRHLFRDVTEADGASYIGNVFALAYGLSPDEDCTRTIEAMIGEKKLSAVNIFGTFAILLYFTRTGKTERLREMYHDEGAWLRMIAEGADVTFEAWGKETKWNTSLFHNTLAYGAAFLTDRNLRELFDVS